MTAQAADPAPTPPSTPVLRLVATHEHTWELRSVEFDDAGVVQEFGCTRCAVLWFR